MSGPTYQRAKAVVVAAKEDPETFGPIAEEMDRTGSVLGAFNKVVDKKSGTRSEPVPTEKQATDVRQLAFSVLTRRLIA